MNRPTAVAYIDMLSCLFAFFVVVFAIAFQVQTKNEGNIIDPSQFLITIEWTDGSSNDIDLIVSNPNDKIVWYNAKSIDGMSLDRDDRGMGGINDPLRREVVSIRTIESGTYSVNILYFGTITNQPEPVKIRVLKLNPYVEICNCTYTLKSVKEERTIVSFTINSKGELIDINKVDQVNLLTEATSVR